MGVVWRAWDEQLRAEVALKTLHDVDANALYRIKHEFRARAGVTHPNLVQLHGLFAEGDDWFITMELVDGQDLLAHARAWAPEGAPPALPWAEVAGLFHQLASALAALHAAGRLHRDVKPGNVMVAASGRVVLLDFGLAAVPGPAGPVTPGAGGTAAYMAPEQIWGELVPASDWYSVGVVFYEVLVGRLPHDGSVGEMLLRKGLGEAPRVRDAIPDVPPALDDLVARLLSPTPGERPAGDEILATLAALGAARPARPPAADAAFVGRSPELERLRGALARVAPGRPVLARVRGPSGIGKSELVRRFLAEASGRGATVLAGRCHPQEAIPYKALDPLVDAASRHLLQLPTADVGKMVPREAPALLRLFPVLERVPAFRGAWLASLPAEPQALRREGVRGLRSLLRALAARQPLVLWIDDMQWGDADGVGLLAELLRGPDAPGMLVVASYRLEDEGRAAPLLQLAEEVAGPLGDDAPVVDVGPLPDDDVRRLAEQVLRAGCPEPTFAGILRESGGSPFFVGELARYLRAEGPGVVRIAEAIGWRLAQLSPAALALLETATLAARPLSAVTILAAAGLQESDRPLVDVLRDACLVRTVGEDRDERVEPYHDRLRDALLARLDDGRRRSAHRRIAETVEREGDADPQLLAEHWLGAGDDARAADNAALAAARAEATLAFATAADLWALTLRLRGDPADAPLRTRLAEALQNAGRCTEAATWYGRAADAEPDPGRRDELRRRAAEQHIHTGDVQRGTEILRGVLAGHGFDVPATPKRAMAVALWHRLRLFVRGVGFVRRAADAVDPAALRRLDALWGASTAFAMISHARSDALGIQHLLLALRVGEPSRLLRAIGYEAAFEAGLGGFFVRRALRMQAQVEALAAETGDPYDRGWAELCAATIHWMRADWGACVEAGRRGEDVFRRQCRGVDWEIAVTDIFLLSALAFRGDVEELRRRVRDGLTDTRQRGDEFAANGFRLGEPTLALLAEDRPDDLLRDADAAIAAWPGAGFDTQHYHHLFATSQALLYKGDPWAAWARLEAGWAGLEGAQILALVTCRSEMLHLRGRVALAAARAGGPPAELARWTRARLVKRARSDARTIRRAGQPWSAALAASVEAGIAEIAGDVEAARALGAEAVAGFAGAGMALHADAARWRLATRAGDASAATEALAAMGARGIVDAERLGAVLAP